MPKTLVVLFDGRRVGTVVQGDSGHLGFTYDEGWKDFPLSLSMPLARLEHGDDVVRAFLWGLLPDSDRVIDRWARRDDGADPSGRHVPGARSDADE